MKKFLAVATMAFVLIGCDPFSGSLSVNQSTDVLIKKGIFSSKLKKFTLVPGQYTASVKVSSKEKATIKIKADGKKLRIPLKIPASANFPTYSGNIVLLSSQSGQPFDLKGDIDTVESQSSTTYGSESCSYREEEWVCRRVVDDQGTGRRECGYEYVTRYGSKEVEYHYDYTDTDIQLDLLEVDTDNVKAHFDGSRHSSRKIYEYQGQCY